MLEVRMLDRNGDRYAVQPDGIDTVRIAVVHANGEAGTVRIHKEQIENLRTALALADAQLPELDADGAYFIDADRLALDCDKPFPEEWQLGGPWLNELKRQAGAMGVTS